MPASFVEGVLADMAVRAPEDGSWKSQVNTLVTWIFWAVALAGVGATIRILFELRFAQRLPSLDSLEKTAVRPKVSVVLAARNEEARIETSVRQLLSQEDVDLEVIVVDDRSSDQTSKILHRLAGEDSRLTNVRVEDLPENWLGKCHACYMGAALATGEWILFTDADVWLKPDAIIRAVLVADRESADHVCLTPGVAPGTLPAQAWHLMFLLGLAGWLARVNLNKRGAYVGMGAFNLVRTQAYQASGGYGKLRLTVVDDVKLGLLLQRAGKRTRGFIGGADAECHWPSNVFGMIKIMEKNYFAILDYRMVLAFGLTISLSAFWMAGMIGPLTGSLAGRAAGLGLFSMCIPAAIVARRLGWSPAGALLIPFILPLIGYAVINSAVVTLRQGGVRWRDTFYPLKVLRKWNVR
jgi:glycosyltransferase involved in cell wall biosynthesis